MSRALVILPSLNERENIVPLIFEILSLQFKFPVDVLVIDDDSEDGTAEQVSSHFHGESRVNVIVRKGKKRGLTASLNDAISASDHDYLLWLDADLQMPYSILPEMLTKISEENLMAVIGSRYVESGADQRDFHSSDPILVVHKHLSTLLNKIAPVILSLPATDLTSGLIVIRRDFFNGRKLKGEHGEYFIELVYELCHGKYQFREAGYLLRPRINGISKSTKSNWFSLIGTGSKYLKAVGRLYLKSKTG